MWHHTLFEKCCTSECLYHPELVVKRYVNNESSLSVLSLTVVVVSYIINYQDVLFDSTLVRCLCVNVGVSAGHRASLTWRNITLASPSVGPIIKYRSIDSGNGTGRAFDTHAHMHIRPCVRCAWDSQQPSIVSIDTQVTSTLKKKLSVLEFFMSHSKAIFDNISKYMINN